MSSERSILFVITYVVALPIVAWAQDDNEVTPQMFGLPPGNVRTADPWEPRAYHAEADGSTPDRKRSPVWTGTRKTPTYQPKDGETTDYHKAIDLSSRDENGTPAELPFKAGVYGTALPSQPGFIKVQLPDKNIVEYLHASKAFLKPGQAVDPDTVIGVTGNRDVNGQPRDGIPIHLHVQVRNAARKILLDPDSAILAGRSEKGGASSGTARRNVVDDGSLRPPVINGVVSYKASVDLYRLRIRGNNTAKPSANGRTADPSILPEPTPLPEPKPLP